MIKKYIVVLLLIAPFILFSADEIDTIIITAEVDEEEAPTTQTSVISEDEIEALPGSTTAELIASVMGVKLSKLGNDSQPSFISIRGSSPEQVLVLLNGKRLNSSQGGGVDLSAIPISSIKKIEVTRGGGSAIYGGSAFGGVVNIITHDNSETNIVANYGFSSGNTHKLSLTYNNTMTEKLTISSNLTGLYSQGNYIYQGRDGDEQRLNSDIKSISGNININLLLKENLELFFTGFIYGADKGVPGLVEFPTDNARIEDLWLNSNIGFDYNEKLHFDLFFQKKDRYYTNEDSSSGSLRDKHEYYNYSSLLSYILKYNKNDFYIKNHFEISGNYELLNSSAYQIDGNVDRLTGSAYISPELTYKRILITPSTRIDIDKSWGMLNSWNIGATYSFDNDERYKLKGNIGNAYRLPSFDDMFWPESSFAVGNPDLSHEKADIYDIGLLLQLTESFKLETTFFLHNVNDIIQWNPGPGGKWTPKNMGKAEMKGVEIETSYMLEAPLLNGYFEGRLNYSYLSALNKTEGLLYDKELINRSMHKGNFILIYNHFSDTIISIDCSYTGDKYITSANTKIFPAYFLLDLNVIFPIKESFKFTGYIKNVLNQTYQDYRGFPIPGISGGINIEYRMDLNE